MNKISIITASYNYENFIKETIESVLAQTYKDWELIIVDDGSQDNSIEVIKSYCNKDQRIKLYTHENNQNKGLAETLRLGLSKANGEWVVFLESDDTIEPCYLEEKTNIISKNKDLSFIYNDVNLFGDKEVIKDYENNYFKKFYSIIQQKTFPCTFKDEFKDINMVPTFSVVMLKKSLLDNIDWDCVVPAWTDYHLWSQIATSEKFYYIDKKLTNWRMHKNSYINKTTNDNKATYFLKVQLINNLSNGKLSFLYKLKYYIIIFKRIFIRFSFKNMELKLFGHAFKF